MKSQSIHGGKIFRYVRGGVKILDAKTMQWRFVANTWYDEDTLSEVFQNHTVRFKRPFKMPEISWKLTDHFSEAVEKMRILVFKIQPPANEIWPKVCFPIMKNMKAGDQFAINH